MIFITVGSQKFQFNRLLIIVDKLIEEGKINDEVFAQVGYCDYEPQNYKYKNFLDRDEFNNYINKSDKIITHGGTGAIISALKNNKKVIVMPRLQRFGEHVDNHQLQITETFEKMNLISGINNGDDLINILSRIDEMIFNKYESKTRDITTSIEEFIRSI